MFALRQFRKHPLYSRIPQCALLTCFCTKRLPCRHFTNGLFYSKNPIMCAPHTFGHETFARPTFRGRLVFFQDPHNVRSSHFCAETFALPTFRGRPVLFQDHHNVRAPHFRYALLTLLCTKRLPCRHFANGALYSRNPTMCAPHTVGHETFALPTFRERPVLLQDPTMCAPHTLGMRSSHFCARNICPADISRSTHFVRSVFPGTTWGVCGYYNTNNAPRRRPHYETLTWRSLGGKGGGLRAHTHTHIHIQTHDRITRTHTRAHVHTHTHTNTTK